MKKDEVLEILSDWNLWIKEIDTAIKRNSYLQTRNHIKYRNWMRKPVESKQSL